MKFSENWKNQRIDIDFNVLDVCRSYVYDGATEDNYFWFLSSPHHYSNIKNVLSQLKCILPADKTLSCIRITSGIRCPKVNVAVGGAKNSYHLHGLAIDIASKEGPDVLKEIWKNAQENKDVHFYEVIWYRKRGFIHLAASPNEYVDTKFIVKN